MICPILSSQSSCRIDCFEEKCAWWTFYRDGNSNACSCAINVIASSLEVIKYISKEKG